MSKGKFALGAVFGAIAGAVAGVLMAPKSGKETRADIKKKAEEVQKDVKKMSKATMDKAEKFADETKENAIDLKRRAGNAVEGAKEGFAKKK